jgi:hypothetical protein
MPTLTTNFQSVLGYAHYIVLMKQSFVDLDLLQTARASGGAQLSAWLDKTRALPTNAAVTDSGSGATFEIQVNPSTLTATNAELASNVAKLTFAAATGAAVGDRIRVASLPSPFASLNGTFTVTAVTTTPAHTISYALTGTNITAASVNAGTVTTGIYPLDGTGKPIRLLNITSLSLNASTNTDSVITHDQETLGSAIPMALSDATTFPFEGSTIIKSVDHKFLELIRTYTTPEQLAVKYLREGPIGTGKKTMCYGMITGIQEGGAGGARQTHSGTLTAIGPVFSLADNS